MVETIDYKILWNYQNVCRTCLSETNELESIFINSKTQHKTYVEMIMACTSLQIRETDEVSLKICPNCINQIEQSYLFSTKCQEANLVLQFSHKFYRKSQNEATSLKNNIEQSNTVDFVNQQTNQLINKQIKCDFEEEIPEQNNESNNDLSAINLDNASLSSDIFVNNQTNQDFKLEERIIEDECNLSDTTSLNKNEENRIVQCKFCLKSYISELLLEKHVKTHSKQRYECGECGFKYTTSRSLSRHKRIHVDVDKTYVCDICNLNFSTAYHLNLHKIMHQNNPKFVCDECGQIVTSKEGFYNHISIHDNTIKRKCEICDVMVHKKHLNTYMYTHNTSKPHICNLCGRGFIQKPQFRQHEIICSKKLNETQTRKELYTCSVCSEDFTSEQDLTDHTQSKHQTEQKVDSVTEYNCIKCKRKFPVKYMYDWHMRSHTFTLQTSCKICNINFETYDKLQEHRKLKHKSLPNKIYKCQTCDKVISSAKGLRTHMLIHTNARPYKCSFCDKTFNRTTHKYAHERVHTGVKPYTCVQCNKSFGHQSSLIEHNRQHTGETQNRTCNICNEKFYRISTFEKHLLTHK